MSELTLTQVFGAGATQDVNTLTISKADLAGLTASINNTADSLVVALILKFQSTLPQSGFDSNLDQSIYVDNGFASFITRGTNNDSYRLDQRVFYLAKLDSGSVLDPDDY